MGFIRVFLCSSAPCTQLGSNLHSHCDFLGPKEEACGFLLCFSFREAREPMPKFTLEKGLLEVSASICMFKCRHVF